MQLPPYQETWAKADPHANFKADVANYTVADPLPTLDNLSEMTGIPVPCLIRYVLVKWAASGSEALLTMEPIALQQMRDHIQRAELEHTDTARLEAYAALRAMIEWMAMTEQPSD